MSTSGLGGHIAISVWPSVSHLFVDTFLEFAVVKNFAVVARITVTLTLETFSGMS